MTCSNCFLFTPPHPPPTGTTTTATEARDRSGRECAKHIHLPNGSSWTTRTSSTSWTHGPDRQGPQEVHKVRRDPRDRRVAVTDLLRMSRLTGGSICVQEQERGGSGGAGTRQRRYQEIGIIYMRIIYLFFQKDENFGRIEDPHERKRDQTTTP